MPRLQEFVGTREYPPKPPVSTSSGFEMHSSSKNERMRAIIQGLASSTDPPMPMSIYGSQDDVFSGLQLNKNENNRLSPPRLGVPDIQSGSLITNTRWHGYRPVVRASHSTYYQSSQDPGPMNATSPGDDIFGTDIENLDSTVASSDVASSDFGGVQSRHEHEDTRIGVFTNPNQRFRTGQPQQGSMLLKREYHEYRNDEYTVPIDKEDLLKDKDGKERKSINDESSNEQGLNEMDRLTRKFDSRVLEGNAGLAPQRLPHAINIRNSTDSSVNTVNSSLKHRRNIAFRASNGELDARFLHADEPRGEEAKESGGDRSNYIPRSSSEAELNYFRFGQGELIKDVQPNFCQVGPSFTSGSEHSKPPKDLDDSSAHFGEINHQKTREESLEKNPDDKATNNFQTVVDTELSKALLELYDTRGKPDAHSQREAFFSALNITQSDRCGEFFIERFVDIVAKYNAIRRQRRDIAAALECEIVGREIHVGMRREVVDRNLDELRQAGKGVVRGKSAILSSE